MSVSLLIVSSSLIDLDLMLVRASASAIVIVSFRNLLNYYYY